MYNNKKGSKGYNNKLQRLYKFINNKNNFFKCISFDTNIELCNFIGLIKYYTNL